MRMNYFSDLKPKEEKHVAYFRGSTWAEDWEEEAGWGHRRASNGEDIERKT